VNRFNLGSTLLHKYRIDRLRRRKDGVVVYEGTDTFHPRRVCIKMLEQKATPDAVARFHDESRAANVVDIGKSEGLHYFVTSEGTLTLMPPAPRPSKPPPPLRLPRPPSSKPPPLPKPKPRALPEIPIFLDDDALVASAPPPPAPVSSDKLLPTSFETKAPPRIGTTSRALLLVAIAAITGFAGWYAGHVVSDMTPAQAASEPVATEVTTTTMATIEPPKPIAPPEAVIEPPPAALSTVTPPAPAPSSKPHARTKVDPLTI